MLKIITSEAVNNSRTIYRDAFVNDPTQTLMLIDSANSFCWDSPDTPIPDGGISINNCNEESTAISFQGTNFQSGSSAAAGWHFADSDGNSLRSGSAGEFNFAGGTVTDFGFGIWLRRPSGYSTEGFTGIAAFGAQGNDFNANQWTLETGPAGAQPRFLVGNTSIGASGAASATGVLADNEVHQIVGRWKKQGSGALIQIWIDGELSGQTNLGYPYGTLINLGSGYLRLAACCSRPTASAFVKRAWLEDFTNVVNPEARIALDWNINRARLVV